MKDVEQREAGHHYDCSEDHTAKTAASVPVGAAAAENVRVSGNTCGH